MTAPGAEFWTALGVRHEHQEQHDAPKQVRSSRRDTPATDPGEWGAMFSSWYEAAPDQTTPPPGPQPEPTAEADPGLEPEPEARLEPQAEPGTQPAPTAEAGPEAENPAEPDAGPEAGIEAQAEPEPAATAEAGAEGSVLAGGGITSVAEGRSLIEELWRDERIAEIHVRGTAVTVYGAHGVHPARGFAGLDVARRTLQAVSTADLDATVAQIAGSTVLSRPVKTGPDLPALIDAGVLTDELVAQVAEALEHTQAVTVTGPAAPVVVRALAALIPAGSRVYEAPFGVLPPGCVTAADPLDADYVVGVRPGTPAEPMAAAGQLGALIANPATDLPTALKLTATGRSTAPGPVRAE